MENEKIINKNGSISKVYARKIWYHVVQATIDSINGDVNDDEWRVRRDEFIKMLNDIPKG